jgi:hypothetical protein
LHEIKTGALFGEQVLELSIQAKRILENKILLLKQNPYRYKRIHFKDLTLFRIRLESDRQEKRVIYLIDKDTVKLICILDRKHDYNDLEQYLKQVGY